MRYENYLGLLDGLSIMRNFFIQVIQKIPSHRNINGNGSRSVGYTSADRLHSPMNMLQKMQQFNKNSEIINAYRLNLLSLWSIVIEAKGIHTTSQAVPGTTSFPSHLSFSLSLSPSSKCTLRSSHISALSSVSNNEYHGYCL